MNFTLKKILIEGQKNKTFKFFCIDRGMISVDHFRRVTSAWPSSKDSPGTKTNPRAFMCVCLTHSHLYNRTLNSCALL